MSSDALGAILTWMQDRVGEAFVIATSNDVSQLPPELLRKGRFDELFFVDLPTAAERSEIVKASLRSFGRGEVEIDLQAVAAATEGFIGAEIASLPSDALFAAFADGAREIVTDDLLRAAKTVIPLSKTAAEKIDRLRSWADTRARRATTAEAATTSNQVQARALDL